MSQIRNFAIIAHIDHGKSTLADRLLEKTNTVKVGSGEQLLDTMELERERGITIKLNPVRMFYRSNEIDYQLNLIDTPGHVDFNYEVSRSLAAVEGALLLVDASQGIQAQTITNLSVVQKLGLKIIPVVNKIDLSHAQPKETAEQLFELTKSDADSICFVSGKTGEGVDELLNKIINLIPGPSGNKEGPLQTLVFDSFYDKFLGVVAYVKVVSGTVGSGQPLQMKATGAKFDSLQVGFLQLKKIKADNLQSGEIGYIATGLRTVQDCRVGDTIVDNPATPALIGYETPKPMVYAALFPESGKERELTLALEKLKLNDAALTFEPIYSKALGPGYNVGFLGLLHLEIIKERLNREFDIDVLVTVPNVAYRETPETSLEPWVRLKVISPKQYYGAISELAAKHRSEFIGVEYFGDRVLCRFDAPLSEVIIDFYNELKSVTSGYASMDYQFKEYRPVDLVAVDLIIAGEKIDALTQRMIRNKAESYARRTVEKLKELIPRQSFEVSVQAAVGGKILARADIAAFRKDVTSKLYGGDISRKRKLLEKQKKGKKKMRLLGRVEVPSEVFVELLRRK